jgi:hypothetical protein
MAKARRTPAQWRSRSTPDDGDGEWRSSCNFTGTGHPLRGAWSPMIEFSARSSFFQECASTAVRPRKFRRVRPRRPASGRSACGRNSARPAAVFPARNPQQLRRHLPYGPQNVVLSACSVLATRLGPDSGARIMAMPSPTGDLMTTTSSDSSGASTPASATG